MNTLKPLLDFYADDASRWTQGGFARNKYGQICEEHEDDAVCWCLLGALFLLKMDTLEAEKELDRRAKYDFVRWQDEPTRTFAEVKALLSQENEPAHSITDES